jgi:hypothetical protein
MGNVDEDGTTNLATRRTAPISERRNSTHMRRNPRMRYIQNIYV